MIKKDKIFEKTMETVYNVLIQGDSRYIDPEIEGLLSAWTRCSWDEKGFCYTCRMLFMQGK